MRNLTLSAAEQQTVITEICNDVLGLRPARTAVGTRRHRRHHGERLRQGCIIEANGKIELTDIKFRDNLHLMNICQRIVSAVGRRVDEASPIGDARLADGSRVNVIAPATRDRRPALTIRKFKRDRLTLDRLMKFGSVVSPEGARLLEIIGFCRINTIVSGGTGSGQDDAAELPDQLYRTGRAGDHLRGRRRTAAAAAHVVRV